MHGTDARARNAARGTMPAVSAYLVLSPYDAEDEPVPHPELVRAQKVTAVQVMQAALVLGAFPESSYLGGQARVTLQPAGGLAG